MKKKLILVLRWGLVPPMLLFFAAFALLGHLFDLGKDESDDND